MVAVSPATALFQATAAGVSQPPPGSNSGTPANTALLSGTVANILGLQTQATEDAANANASNIQSTGYQAEAGAYGDVQAIAGNNATVAGIAGQVKLLQQNRAYRTTVGAQQADVATNGFANSGTSLDLMRSSVQQSALERQLINVQTSQTQGGYLEEGAAAGAEIAAATTASSAAQALAVQQAAAGQLATANAANETSALQNYIQGTTTTPESQLTLSTLNAPGGTPTTFNPALVAPIANGTQASLGYSPNRAPSVVAQPNLTATANPFSNPGTPGTGVFAPPSGIGPGAIIG